jgi:hypothetical protein
MGKKIWKKSNMDIYGVYFDYKNEENLIDKV